MKAVPYDKINYATLLIGIAAFAYYAFSGGLMTTFDSGQYVSASYSLFHHGTLELGNGQPYTAFPPLYPALLWFTHWFASPLQAMAGLHVILFALNAILLLRLYRNYVKDSFSVTVLLAMTVLSAPFVVNHIFIWSEAFFYTLCIPWFILSLHALKQPNWRNIITLTIVSILLTLQRKTGFLFILTSFSALLLFSDRRSLSLLAKAVLYAAVSGTFTVLWRYRAQTMEGNFMYNRNFSLAQTGKAINELVTELGSWLVPRALPAAVDCIMVLLLIGWLVYQLRKSAMPTYVKLALLLAFIYTSGIIAFMTFYKLSQMVDIRIMGSILPFLLLIVGYGLAKPSDKPAWKYARMAILAFVLLYNIARTARNYEQWKSVPKSSLEQLLAKH